MTDTPHAPTKAERIDRRRVRVAFLTGGGATIDQTAKELGCSTATVKRDLAAIREVKGLADDDTPFLIRQGFRTALETLERLSRDEHPGVASSAAGKLSLAALRYAKVTGLASPEKHEVTGGLADRIVALGEKLEGGGG